MRAAAVDELVETVAKLRREIIKLETEVGELCKRNMTLAAKLSNYEKGGSNASDGQAGD